MLTEQKSVCKIEQTLHFNYVKLCMHTKNKWEYTSPTSKRKENSESMDDRFPLTKCKLS